MTLVLILLATIASTYAWRVCSHFENIVNANLKSLQKEVEEKTQIRAATRDKWASDYGASDNTYPSVPLYYAQRDQSRLHFMTRVTGGLTAAILFIFVLVLTLSFV
jgi:hypothetical protein